MTSSAAKLLMTCILLAATACDGSSTLTGGAGGSGGSAGAGGEAGGGSGGAGGDAGSGGSVGGSGGSGGAPGGQGGQGGQGGCQVAPDVCDGLCGVQLDGCGELIDCGICTTDCPLPAPGPDKDYWDYACSTWAPMDNVCGGLDATAHGALCGAYPQPKVLPGCAYYGMTAIGDIWCCCDP